MKTRSARQFQGVTGVHQARRMSQNPWPYSVTLWMGCMLSILATDPPLLLLVCTLCGCCCDCACLFASVDLQTGASRVWMAQPSPQTKHWQSAQCPVAQVTACWHSLVINLDVCCALMPPRLALCALKCAAQMPKGLTSDMLAGVQCLKGYNGAAKGS
jgi:hypothetical protein